MTDADPDAKPGAQSEPGSGSGSPADSTSPVGAAALPTPRVAVGAIVFAGDRVLLVERGSPPGVGLWTVPGGKLEPGETLADAVVREVHEETGLRVRCGALVEVIERAGPAYHYVILDYIATLDAPGVPPPPPTAGDDVRAARWVAWDELASLPLTEGLVPVLERARALVVSAGVPR